MTVDDIAHQLDERADWHERKKHEHRARAEGRDAEHHGIRQECYREAARMVREAAQ